MQSEIKELIGEALDIIYGHPMIKEKDWVIYYGYECHNVYSDIELYFLSMRDANIPVTKEAISNLLIFLEYVHISNDQMVKRNTIDFEKLNIVSEKIIDLFKKER